MIRKSRKAELVATPDSTNSFLDSYLSCALAGTDRDTPLWQVQVAGAARGNFTYSMVSTAREALAHHPVEAVRSLYDLENILKVRLQFGGPQPGGQLDPDGVHGRDPVASRIVCSRAQSI